MDRHNFKTHHQEDCSFQSGSTSTPIIPSILPNAQTISSGNSPPITYPGTHLQTHEKLDSVENSRTKPNKESTNFRKRRIRVVKACDRCRSQKTKCTGTIPCRSCIKHGIECNYSTRSDNNKNTRKLGANKIRKKDNSDVTDSLNLENNGTTYSPNISSSTVETRKDEYIAKLEAKIEELQSLHNLKVNNASPLHNQAETVDHSSAFTFEATYNDWKYMCRHQSILTFKLFKTIYNNLSDESKLHVSMPRIQGFGWNMSGGRYLTPEKLPSAPEFELPLADFYVDYYFCGINSVFAILHEVVFREQIESYNSLLSEERSTFIDHNDEARLHETRLFQAQLYLVYALSIRFSEFQNPKSNSVNMLILEEKLFKYAHKIIQILSFQWESFELIQGWLLITLYLRITHRLSSSFMALGNAITMTRAMGLGNRDPMVRKSTNYQHLKAKRIFWCVYTFDRLFGLQYGRYCGISDTDIFRPYPKMDFEMESDGWLTLPAFAMIHLARISSFINDLASDNLTGIDVQNLDRNLDDLEKWFNENGFNDDDLLANINMSHNITDLAKIQVKLHYYDLLFYFHGRSLFRFIGENVNLEKLSLQTVLDISKKSLLIFQKLKKAKLLDIPWYMTLLLIFNIGVYSALFINSGLFLKQSKENLSNSISLISYLQEASFIEPKSNKLE